MALLPRREVPPSIVICQDGFLPKPPDVYCGVYLRDRLDCERLEALADAMAEALGLPPGHVAEAGGDIDAQLGTIARHARGG